MSHRFPLLRTQDQMMHKTRSSGRTIPVPTLVDLSLCAALILVMRWRSSEVQFTPEIRRGS